MANKFRAQEACDHEIYDNATDQKVGDVRVKPSGVLWSPSGSHRWYRVTLAQFAQWMEQNGTKQNK